MILGSNRKAVIENIKTNLKNRDYHAKVEINDPVLTHADEQAIVDKYLSRRDRFGCRVTTLFVRLFANLGSEILNSKTKIVGVEKLGGTTSGIITCNHFNPLDNTAVRKLSNRLGKKRLNIICQLTNFAMKGPMGFLMNYADTIPLSEERHYMSKKLPEILKSLFDRQELVLIYPEKEMWFNYRVPRPPLRGAYLFAAKLNAPIISCFIEIQDLEKQDPQNFKKVRYTLHILGVLTPDPDKNVRDNSIELAKRDYELKCNAYERIYGKKISYDYSPDDIAGWRGE